MDKCRDIRRLLFEYNRSELDPERHRRVQAHLEGCPNCSTYFQETVTLLNPITYQRKGTVPVLEGIGGTFLSIADNFWPNYDTKLFERLENTRNRIFFQLGLPKLRPVITETLAGLLVLFVLFAMIEKGLEYDLKTYLYLLKQVW